MNRFFVDEKNISEEEAQIIINDIEDVKHIKKVLRLTEGDCIEVCDGNKNEYIGKISSLLKSEIRLNILEKKVAKTEPKVDITLFQGIPKSSKMDIIIQKCTELGIHKIVPIITERTIVQIKDKKAEAKKIERWQKVAEAAAKQCKRGIIPNIGNPIPFKEMLKLLSEYDLSIIPYEQEKNTGLKRLIKKNKDYKKIAIIIGPEGGFEKSEIIGAQEKGTLPITLGPRILRTETAGFVALSILMYEIGDLGGI
ncbi:16S rRNA (uracil(1498)-N(3))-methyltransferase [Crassaminicella thermophila]|uniref:Ribosomal RNA small subunit methyltransferase E n=1 Tax=Crassaminicella thermophila TaxID=2599308 RepID=A0A5C0SF54_CRATE|nr:16S rRNA (uracil(1498)-N(3))-methyltransferase [Crassaminicella thermophila]QEK12367.1 16S rRNA (uracil(1498)-N(3))-methyltransferase [Crassaminicella thermophila]